MAYGDRYTHFANEKFATITDPDVCFIDTSGSVIVENFHYLVIKHIPISLNMIPKVLVNNEIRVLTVFPDGKYLNANRVSPTQSVLKNVSGETLLIEVLEEYVPFPSTDPAVGSGIIGSSFIVR